MHAKIVVHTFILAALLVCSCGTGKHPVAVAQPTVEVTELYILKPPDIAGKTQDTQLNWTDSAHFTIQKNGVVYRYSLPPGKYTLSIDCIGVVPKVQTYDGANTLTVPAQK